MPTLPIVGATEAVVVFKQLGYDDVRRRGRFVILEHQTNPADHKNLTILMAPKLAVRTLLGYIKFAGITIETFCDYLRQHTNSRCQ